jgi:hypothetical protein
MILVPLGIFIALAGVWYWRLGAWPLVAFGVALALFGILLDLTGGDDVRRKDRR